MTPEQEEKFEKWVGEYRESKTYKQSTTFDDIKNGWEACLSANGIGDTTESAAPAWVIDMMRTGKPVRCEVSNGEEEWERQCFVTGYDIKAVDAFSDEYGTSWKYARPIPAWRPKDGEAVLTRVMDRAEVGYVSKGFLYVRGNRMPIEQVEDFVPFDDDKIGKPWSEV